MMKLFPIARSTNLSQFGLHQSMALLLFFLQRSQRLPFEALNKNLDQIIREKLRD
jgi:hypothetical protein